MVIVLSVIIGAILGSLSYLVYYYAWRTPTTPADRARRDYLSARRHVDEVVHNARRAMDEAAGLRRPGELRLGDDFGTWQEWL